VCDTKQASFVHLESLGKSLMMGNNTDVTSIGAVWLLIHMQRKREKYITASRKACG
jgi:hypothetical protein